MAFISDLAGDDKRNMPHVDDSVRQQAIGFQSLPDFLQVLQAAYGPQAQGELAAQAGVSPGYNQLGLNLAQQYAPQFTQLGNQINQQQAIGDINTDTAALRALQANGGLDVARQLDIAADPLYNAQRSNTYGALDNYLKMLSPTLNGSEMAQIQRGIGATGGINAPSQTRTLQNAASFGQAGQNKMAAFGQGLNNAASILQNTKLPIGSFTGGFGKQRQNFGLSQYQGIKPLSDTANQFGSQFMNQVGGYVDAMNQYKAGRKPTGDKVAQDVNTAASITGAVGGM